MNYEIKYQKLIEGKKPIYKGCLNEQCFCTGRCREIVGWIEEIPSPFKTKDSDRLHTLCPECSYPCKKCSPIC